MIGNDEISETFAAARATGAAMSGGLGAGPEDLFDDEGYDEAQRAEILEVESTGPNDGIVQTDLRPDLGGGDADDDEIEDGEDQLETVEDSEELLPDDAAELVEGDEDDFDVDDENDNKEVPGAPPGPLGA